VTGVLEQVRDRVAVRAVARRGNGDRPSGVRGDHLDVDALLRGRRARAEVSVDRRNGVDEELVRHPEVDEAGAGDFGARDGIELLGAPGEIGREVARRAALPRREPERDVGRVVAVLGLRRPLELDRRARELGDLSLEAFERATRQRLC
jgi:hypothetical protein